MNNFTEEELLKSFFYAFSSTYSMQIQCLFCKHGLELQCAVACEVTGLWDMENTKWYYQDLQDGKNVLE